MNTENIMELKHVTKRFSGLVAVNDLSMQIKPNTIHALIGPNGAGKTTSMNLISGVIPPTEGEILFKNTKLNDLPTYKIAQLGIGRTFQNIKLFPTLTAMENIMVGAHAHTKIGITRFLIDIPGVAKEEGMMREKAKEMLEFVGMYKDRNELVKNLPYGHQKVLELARALVTDPDLLLLDEPAAGLNPSERAYFLAILEKVRKQGKTLLLIEHNMDVVMSISDMITVISFGSKIAEGNVKEIQNDPDVIAAYLGSRFQKTMQGGEG